MTRAARVLATICSLSPGFPAFGWQEQPNLSTREQAIQLERDAKAAALVPEALPPAENAVRRFQDARILERLTSGAHGWRLKLGGMGTGGGFALGPEWSTEEIAGGYMSAKASAQISTRAWQKYRTEVLLPHLAGDRLAAGLTAEYRNYNSLDYYGPGPNSVLTGRSNYRMEDTLVQGATVLRPQRRLKLGFGIGYQFVNVGPGQRVPEFASTDQIYNEEQAPGIQDQTNFLRYGLFTQYDYRDNALGPKRGGNYVFQWVWYKDLEKSHYSFRRFDIDWQQYIGFFNDLRRLALRARATFTEVSDSTNRVVPFYLRPTVGGSDDLRGYRTYRFNDANSMVLNAEYRWEIFSGLDGALFYDAGKVMPKAGQLAFSQLKSSAGFGFRANIRNQTFLRLDVGFSREGFMIWFKFNDAFNSQRFGTSTMQPVN